MVRNAKNMKKEYEAAVGQASAVAFIAIARRHPEVTLDDLFNLATEQGLGHLTVKQVFLEEDFMKFGSPKALTGGKSGKIKKKLPKVSKAKGAKGAKKVSLRTVAEREVYRLRVLDSCGTEFEASSQILARSGGNASQILKVLNDLIEEGLVEYTGQARGTRYKLSKKGIKAKGK